MISVICLAKSEALFYLIRFLVSGQIYLLDIHVFYTIISAIWGFLLGAKDRLGEVSDFFFVYICFFLFMNMEADPCCFYIISILLKFYISFPFSFLISLFISLGYYVCLKIHYYACNKSRLDLWKLFTNFLRTFLELLWIIFISHSPTGMVLLIFFPTH